MLKPWRVHQQTIRSKLTATSHANAPDDRLAVTPLLSQAIATEKFDHRDSLLSPTEGVSEHRIGLNKPNMISAHVR